MLLELPFPAHAVCNEQGVPVSLCLWPLWPPRYHFPRGHRAAGLQRAPGLSRSEQHQGELHTAPRGVLRAQVPGAPLAQTALPSGAEALSFWLLSPSLPPPASQPGLCDGVQAPSLAFPHHFRVQPNTRTAGLEL